MATYNIHAGHCPDGNGAHGAVGLLYESTENRAVKNKVIELLRQAGHTVYDCTCDTYASKDGCLQKIVSKCNQHNVDYDISIHLNSGRNDYKGDGSTGGCEVWNYDSRTADISNRICTKISAALNIRNRGTKYDKSLKVLRDTRALALLIECCFVDDADDVMVWNVEVCAKAIVEGILNSTVNYTPSTPAPNPQASLPNIALGTYKLLYNMKVRKGAGLNYAQKKKSELTEDGQRCSNANGSLLAGTAVTVKETVKLSRSVWGRIPSGWVCLYMDGQYYVA